MRRLLRSDGTTLDFDKPLSLDEISTLINADTLDIVSLVDGIHVMCVDDIGLYKDLPVNQPATYLYWDKCGGPVDWQIHGDVVIVPDDDYVT